MSDERWIEYREAKALVDEHGIIGVYKHPACYDFKLGNGRVLALYPGDDQISDSWHYEADRHHRALSQA